MHVAISLMMLLLLGGVEPLPEGWRRIDPPGLGFSVALPGTPTEKRHVVKSPRGTGDARFFLLATRAGTFAAGCTTYPEVSVGPGEEEMRLDQARDGAVQEVKGRVRWEKKLQADGAPARELFIATETGNAIKMRLIADRNRLFQLLTVGDTAFLDSAEARRFLDSFRRRK